MHLHAKRYVTNCVNAPDLADMDAGESIQAMQHAATPISRATFLRHVDRDDQTALEQSLSYDTGTERGGLRMAHDWHVGYYRSTYNGRPCVYFDHSRIEYIFQENNQP